MNRMRRIALVTALVIAVGPLARAGDTDERKKETTTYESPVLSLLFLPANVLIKLASLLAPQDSADSAKASRESARPADTGK